jgi:hypothetical protein
MDARIRCLCVVMVVLLAGVGAGCTGTRQQPLPEWAEGQARLSDGRRIDSEFPDWLLSRIARAARPEDAGSEKVADEVIAVFHELLKLNPNAFAYRDVRGQDLPLGTVVFRGYLSLTSPLSPGGRASNFTTIGRILAETQPDRERQPEYWTAWRRSSRSAVSLAEKFYELDAAVIMPELHAMESAWGPRRLPWERE